MQIPMSINKDSLYKPVERLPREFRKLQIPAKLQEQLPFASKPKNNNAPAASTASSKFKSNNSFVKGSLSLQSRREMKAKLDDKTSRVSAIISEPGERKERALLSMLQTIKKDKTEKRVKAQEKRKVEKEKKLKKESEKFDDVKRLEKKRKYKEEGLKQMKKMKAT
jgi:ribosome biogenesis protein BMS1